MEIRIIRVSFWTTGTYGSLADYCRVEAEHTCPNNIGEITNFLKRHESVLKTSPMLILLHGASEKTEDQFLKAMRKEGFCHIFFRPVDEKSKSFTESLASPIDNGQNIGLPYRLEHSWNYDVIAMNAETANQMLCDFLGLL